MLMAEGEKQTSNMAKEEKQAIDLSAQSELEEKAKLVDEYLDQLQRLQAEFENYRKRVVKEKEEFKKYVLEKFLYELVDVVDNIHRVISAAKQSHNYDSLVEGINIVERQFLELLKSQGVVPIKVNVGDRFDPKIHHAVGHEASEQYPADTIINILQQGYNIAERVLRPAMVTVSSGPGSKEKQK